MRKLHQIRINDDRFCARSGQLILDAALVNGVDLAHDCRAGRCGTCLARVIHGITLGGETIQAGLIHTCQARAFSDLELEVDDLPPVGLVYAHVVDIGKLSHDVFEVVLAPKAPIKWLPGQYCRFTFRGFPARAFSPTLPLDGSAPSGRIHLNIKRVRDGRVSAQLGRRILPGHKVGIEGPFGHAFLRPARRGRLVLVAGGTGFAPIWAIAMSALRQDPDRPIVLIVGIRSLASCYMASAIEYASRFPNVSVVVCSAEPSLSYRQLRCGSPSDHLPALGRFDTVYSAGAPAMVADVAAQAAQAHCQFYCDPFEPAIAAPDDWFSKMVGWMKAS